MVTDMLGGLDVPLARAPLDEGPFGVLLRRAHGRTRDCSACDASHPRRKPRNEEDDLPGGPREPYVPPERPHLPKPPRKLPETPPIAPEQAREPPAEYDDD
jgi:hypothetical protein